MKKGIFILLSRFPLTLVLGLFYCSANGLSISSAPGAIASLPTPISRLDSGNVHPPGGVDSSTTITPYYAGVAVPSKPVTNEQYANLGACPANPVCPDINGNTPNNATVNCPDFCTVDRIVQKSTSGSVVKITSTTAAACPLGYTVVGTYKVDQEIVRVDNPPPAPFPITDSGVYLSYTLAGYSCIFIPQGVQTKCGVNTVDLTTLNNGSYPVPPTYYIGQFNSMAVDPVTYCPNTGCTTPCPNIPGVIAADNKYIYTFSYTQCTPPPGLFYSGNMVPTSLVCASRKPTWLKPN